MIDTIHISLKKFEILKENNFRIHQSSVSSKTGEVEPDFVLWENDSGKVRGKKACHNSDIINVTIEPFFGRVYCFVNFSASKVFYGNSNYFPVNKNQFKRVIDIVGDELFKIGIKTNIYEAELRRVDIFENVVTDRPYNFYSTVFSEFKPSRMKKSCCNGSVLFWNKQHAINIYDKNKEMKDKKQSITNLPSFVTRFEYRMLTMNKIINCLKVKTIQGL
ncbi:hypothetical protein ACFL5P_00935 [candidate division KSB1 bacterium]